MKEKSIIEKIWKFLPIIGLFILVYMMYIIGIDKIINAFKTIPIYYYFLALVPLIPREILRAYKWQYISKKQKMFFKLAYLLKISIISFFYGSITFGGVGWHVRIFYLKNKSNSTTEKCLVNSLIEMTTSFLTGLFISLIGTIILFKRYPEILPIVLIFFMFYLTVFIVLIKKSRGSKLFRVIIKLLIPRKYKEIINQSVDRLYEDIPSLKDILPTFVIDGIVYLLMGIQAYIIAIPFNINIPFFDFILISTISVVFTGIIPIGVSGIGVREGMFVILAKSYGVAPDIAIVISLGGYIVKSLVLSVTGFILSIKTVNMKNKL